MFEIGDIVTGLTVNQYAITNSRGTFEVVGVTPYSIIVKVITHSDFSMALGKVYTVPASRFRLITPFDPKKTVLRKIAHLNNLFENRNKSSISEYDLAA